MNSNFTQQLSDYKIDDYELKENSSYSDYSKAKNDINQSIENRSDKLYRIACIPLFIVFLPIFIVSLLLCFSFNDSNNDNELNDMIKIVIFVYLISLVGLLVFSYYNHHQETFIAFLVLIITPIFYLIVWLIFEFIMKEKIKKNIENLQKRELYIKKI